MKKIVLLVSILMGIGMKSYSISIDKEEEVNRTIIKELTSFYGGYENIYSSGITKDNITFLLNEIKYKDSLKKEFDLKNLEDNQIVVLDLDDGVILNDIADLKKLKVIDKTFKNSSMTLKKQEDKLMMFFSSIGDYKVKFTFKDDTEKVINFRKRDNYSVREEDVESNIESAYSNKDVEFLTENLDILTTFFPDSTNVENALFYTLELNEESKNYKVVRRTAKDLVSKYDLTEDKKAEIIELYLNALKKLNEKEEYLNFLEKLSNYDSKYDLEFLEASVNYKDYNDKALKLAKDQLEIKVDSNLSDYLGDYYHGEENYKMALIYYKASNNLLQLAKIYLETDDLDSFNNLEGSTTPENVKKIEDMKADYLEEKQLSEYIEKAENLIADGRLQEAELYYERSLEKKLTPKQKNEITYKLLDVYYKLDELEMAEKTLGKVDPEILDKEYLGNYYYLGGIIYYDLKRYDESVKHFEKLVRTFPNSTLSNRGKIYILKIKNKK